MLILRCLFYSYVVKDHDPRSFYYGLISLPKVAVIHGLFVSLFLFFLILRIFLGGSYLFNISLPVDNVQCVFQCFPSSNGRQGACQGNTKYGLLNNDQSIDLGVANNFCF